jgi:hypothetical protein
MINVTDGHLDLGVRDTQKKLLYGFAPNDSDAFGCRMRVGDSEGAKISLQRS